MSSIQIGFKALDPSLCPNASIQPGVSIKIKIYLNANTKLYSCIRQLTLTNYTSCDKSLLPPLGNVVLMSYLPLKLKICCFLSFSIVKFRFLIEI